MYIKLKSNVIAEIMFFELSDSSAGQQLLSENKHHLQSDKHERIAISMNFNPYSY